MSLMRVIWLSNWDLTDMTYTVTPGAIYSVLEPTLGVVNACLPTIKPAINMFLGESFIHWSKNTSRSDSKPGIRSSRDHQNPQTTRDNYYHDFVRFDDDIPLTSIRVGSRPREGLNQGSNITITRAWEVDSALHSNTERALTDR